MNDVTITVDCVKYVPSLSIILGLWRGIGPRMSSFFINQPESRTSMVDWPPHKWLSQTLPKHWHLCWSVMGPKNLQIWDCSRELRGMVKYHFFMATKINRHKSQKKTSKIQKKCQAKSPMFCYSQILPSEIPSIYPGESISPISSRLIHKVLHDDRSSSDPHERSPVQKDVAALQRQHGGLNV